MCNELFKKLINHIGYAQVLEEATWYMANPDPAVDTPDEQISYIFGDDVIAQKVNGITIQYLLCDAHGSIRQLAQYDGTDTVSIIVIIWNLSTTCQ